MTEHSHGHEPHSTKSSSGKTEDSIISPLSPDKIVDGAADLAGTAGFDSIGTGLTETLQDLFTGSGGGSSKGGHH